MEVYMAKGQGDERYDDAFNAEAVSLLIDKKLTLRKAATEVGVSYETLRTWVEASGRRAAVQETKSDQQRIKELERENRSLRMERDILKEAVGIFSQRPK